MEWWVWVLIGVGVVLIGYLKLKVFSAMKKNAKKKNRFEDEE